MAGAGRNIHYRWGILGRSSGCRFLVDKAVDWIAGKASCALTECAVVIRLIEGLLTIWCIMGFVNRCLRRRMSGGRFTSAMLLVSYAFTAIGVPLPAGASETRGDELFPCSDHACGCPSAEQCWRSCCCHTLAERFAWAREHKVRPPEYAIAEARRDGIDVAWLHPTAPGSAGGSSGQVEGFH